MKVFWQKVKWHFNFIKQDKTARLLLVAPAICCLLALAAVIRVVDSIVREPHHPTYKEICAPNHFVQKFYYYHDKAYAICGSETTEPVIVELR